MCVQRFRTMRASASAAVRRAPRFGAATAGTTSSVAGTTPKAARPVLVHPSGGLGTAPRACRACDRIAPPWPSPSSTAAPCAASRRPRSRSRSISPTACRASRSSASPTPRSRNRASGCAPRCRRAASSSRTTSASPSASRRPTCPRSRAASTCRSRSASSPRPASIDAARLDAFEFAGELSLGGELRPVHGALAMALALRRHAGRRRRARWCCRRRAPTSRRWSAGSRCAAPPICSTSFAPSCPATRPTMPACAHRGRCRARAAPLGHDLRRRARPGGRQARARGRRRGRAEPADGRAARHRQVDAGAAARRPAAAAVARRGARVGGDPERRRRVQRRRWGERVLRAPHHTASAAALVGGGSPPRPGEASLAHHGVLFLDELPEFPRAALEALREPLETGRIVVSRAARQADFPAAFQLVAAMNPCPCGQLGNPAQRVPLHARRGAALPGPDQRPAARPHRPADRGAGGRRPSSSPAPPTAKRARSSRRASRGAPARARAPGRGNGALAGAALDRHCRLDADALAVPAEGDGAARLVGAQLSPRAARRPHGRRPRGERDDHHRASRRSDPVPARLLRTPAGRAERRALEQRRERALGRVDAARAALGPALQLVGADLADVEVASPRDARGRSRDTLAAGSIARLSVRLMPISSQPAARGTCRA